MGDMYNALSGSNKSPAAVMPNSAAPGPSPSSSGLLLDSPGFKDAKIMNHDMAVMTDPDQVGPRQGGQAMPEPRQKPQPEPEITPQPQSSVSPMHDALASLDDRMKMNNPEMQGPRLDLVQGSPAEAQMGKDAMHSVAAGVIGPEDQVGNIMLKGTRQALTPAAESALAQVAKNPQTMAEMKRAVAQKNRIYDIVNKRMGR